MDDLSQRATAQLLCTQIAEAVDDRNGSQFLSLCESAYLPFVYGAMRAYYLKDRYAFEWMMYILSIHKGYEDLVCEFWITNWQRLHEAPTE